MPFYDYICSNCGHEMEVRHSVHGHGPTECPKCHGQMRKSISAPAVHFKGTGWARKEPSGGKGRAAAAPKAESAESAAPSAGSNSSASGSNTGAPDSSSGAATSKDSD